jgi:hypothetical protein
MNEYRRNKTRKVDYPRLIMHDFSCQDWSPEPEIKYEIISFRKLCVLILEVVVLSVCLLGFIDSAYARTVTLSDGRTATYSGNTIIYSDGTSANTYGNTTVYSNGTSAHRSGRSTTYSDGSYSYRSGNQQYNSDGSQYQYSDGYVDMGE